MISSQQRRTEAEAAKAGARFSVIVPAHNEEAVIARCLRSIYSGAPAGQLPEVIVAANGCTDQTVSCARKAAPDAIILELPQPSKVAAINRANAVAQYFPRLIMDADVEASYASLAATADILRADGIMAASPRMRLDLGNCSTLVRSYYKVWLTLPYASDGLVGGGVYGLSKEGMERVAPFPDVIGDDLYVRTRFTREERANIAHDDSGNPIGVVMTPPANLGQLIAIETRRRMGKSEVDRNHPTPETGRINHWQDLINSLFKGASVFDVIVYSSVKVFALVRCKLNQIRGQRVWARDSSSRSA